MKNIHKKMYPQMFFSIDVHPYAHHHLQNHSSSTIQCYPCAHYHLQSHSSFTFQCSFMCSLSSAKSQFIYNSMLIHVLIICKAAAHLQFNAHSSAHYHLQSHSSFTIQCSSKCSLSSAKSQLIYNSMLKIEACLYQVSWIAIVWTLQ